jgi:hypothetical protein
MATLRYCTGMSDIILGLVRGLRYLIQFARHDAKGNADFSEDLG